MKKTISIVALVLLAAGLFAQSTATGTARQAATTEVTITVTNVQGAQVTVEGKASTAPVVVQLKAGSYPISIQAPNFVPLNTTINVESPASKKQAFTFQLQPIKFRLTVNANVKEATVAVNNVGKGAAGYAEDLAPGTYTILVSAPGYQAFSQTVNLDRPTTVAATLQAIKYRLTVNANVKEATVAVNNVGKGAAGYSEELPPATYTVLVAAPGYDSYTETVNLNRQTTVTANLKRTVFRLTVNANVKEAAVSVNNVAKGTAGYTEELPPGTYTVAVTAAGYEAYAETVNLNKQTTVTANLKAALATLVLAPQYLEGETQFVKIYVDGKLVNAQVAVKGALQVPAGKHKVRVASAPVGLASEAEFDFVAGQKYEIRFLLQFAPVQQ